jgi:sigma-E factor negative regulatory protein RseA
MSEQIRESLSVLMDEEANELDIERVLQHSDNSAVRAVWARYHTVRQIMREGSGRQAQVDIASRVMAVLEVEPEIRPVARWHNFLRPAASFAVAASMFAAVLIGSQFYNLLGGEGGFAPQLSTQVSTVGMVNTLGGSAVKAGYASPALRPQSELRYADSNKLARERLQRYLLTHAGEAALNAPQGMMPYARVASFEVQD